jgi:hypothetical protein
MLDQQAFCAAVAIFVGYVLTESGPQGVFDVENASLFYGLMFAVVATFLPKFVQANSEEDALGGETEMQGKVSGRSRLTSQDTPRKRM